MATRREDKKFAKIFCKIVDGKFSSKDVYRFLDLSYSQSIFTGKIKDVPFVNIGEFGSASSRGRYNVPEQSIFINKVVLDEMASKKEGAISDILNIHGHELTHHLQRERGDYFASFDLTPEQLTGVMKYMGLRHDEKFVGAFHYAQYRNLSEERLAREGGERYSKGVMTKLVDNKFVKGKYKDVAKKELAACDNMGKKEKDLDKECIALYDSFKKMSIDVVCHLEQTSNDPNAHVNSFLLTRMRSQVMQPKEIAKDFCATLGTEALGAKMGMLSIIKSQEFPEDIRDNLRNSVTNFLCKSTTDARYFNNDLYGFLQKEDYIKIYNNLLGTNVQKFRSRLFFGFCDNEEKACQFLGEALINNFKNGNVNLNGQEDRDFFEGHLDMLLKDKDNLSSDVLSGIKQIGDNLGLNLSPVSSFIK